MFEGNFDSLYFLDTFLFTFSISSWGLNLLSSSCVGFCISKTQTEILNRFLIYISEPNILYIQLYLTIIMLITTGIGSLPFESASEAVAYSLLHDVPFLPEIPKDIDMFQLIEKGKAASLDIFKEKIKNLKVRTIKVQCTGPVSLMLYRGYKKEDAIKLVEDYLKNTL